MNSRVVALIALTVALSGCNDGGQGTVSTDGVYYTHEQLATEFVNRASGDAGISVQLVKSYTRIQDYIVVYDTDYKTYDAYYIGDFHVGDNVGAYITAHDSQNYYDLSDRGYNVYKDETSGTVFEETSASAKDLQKVAALKQELSIQKAAKNIKAQFGLSDERSRDVARLAVELATTNKKSMTNDDYEHVSKELLGTSIGKFQAAMRASAQGSTTDLNSIIESAAQLNGVGPEHMNQIMTQLFSGL